MRGHDPGPPVSLGPGRQCRRGAAVQPRPEETANTDSSRSPAELPPLLRQILAEYSATGLPPAYLPKDSTPPQAEQGGEA